MSLERKLLGRWHNGDLLPEEYMQLMKETKQLLAQPEQDNIQYLLDQVSRLTAENAMLKEKWSTPKPEQEPFFQNTYSPLGLEEIMDNFYDKLNADTTIPVDSIGFNEGVFEVIINWRKE